MAFGETIEIEHNGEGLDLSVDGAGRLSIITDGDKAAQDLVVLFKTQTGEDQFHPNFGMDFAQVIDSSVPEIVVETVILQALTQYQYVKEIVSMRILDTDEVERSARLELVLKLEDTIETVTVVI